MRHHRSILRTSSDAYLSRTAEEFLASRFTWQIFITLTFERVPPEGKQLSLVFVVLRAIASSHRIRFHRMIWILRRERGRKTERPHFHLLITGLPGGALLPKTSELVCSLWQRVGGGSVEVKAVSSSPGVAGYVCKPSWLLPNDGRESAKFGSRCCELMLSRGAEDVLLRRRR